MEHVQEVVVQRNDPEDGCLERRRRILDNFQLILDPGCGEGRMVELGSKAANHGLCPGDSPSWPRTTKRRRKKKKKEKMKKVMILW